MRITRMVCAAITAGVLSIMTFAQGDMLISAVYDGPLTGGTPKGVELYVVNDIPDLSIYGLGSANNGGGTDGQEFTFPSGSATAGSFIYVASSADPFLAYFGFSPDFVSSSMSINGDDAVELFQGGVVIDVYGDINVDGNGDPWEYLDGWAYRVDGTTANGGVFSDLDFTYSGANAVDGCSTNDTCASSMPVGTFVLGGGGPDHIVTQKGFVFSPQVIDVEIGDTIQWIWTGGTHSVDSGTKCTPDFIWFRGPLSVVDPTFTWTVPSDAPTVIEYLCDVGFHCETNGMTGVINVLNGGQIDSDGDGWFDDVDNCPNIPNPGQEDCDANGIGDVCDVIVDCNNNGVPDACESFADCNENGISDECDLADGTLHDDNQNGYPDECEFPSVDVQLQEIRIDQLGADDDEYAEIHGYGSPTLDGLYYIVIGDGAGASGVVENVTNLSGIMIPASGTLLLAEDADTLGAVTDVIVSLNFENSDNVTHVLVMNYYGSNGDDLDIDDDGVLDVTPWTDIVDGVRIIKDTLTGEHTYLDLEAIGPTADGFAPSHVYRYTSACGNFAMGTFDPLDPLAADTPGLENPACPSNCIEDVDGDGTVAVSDILLIIGAWGTADPVMDLDANGTVGVSDLLLIIAAWGAC